MNVRRYIIKISTIILHRQYLDNHAVSSIRGIDITRNAAAAHADRRISLPNFLTTRD